MLPDGRPRLGRPLGSGFRTVLSHVRFGSLADIRTSPRHVRFTPDSGHSSVQVGCPLSANSGRSRGQNASEPWNFSAVSDVASVSPNWTPTFIENAIAEGSLACSSPLALALPD